LKLKRREFLKLAGATGAGLALSQLGFNVRSIEAASKECRIHGIFDSISQQSDNL